MSLNPWLRAHETLVVGANTAPYRVGGASRMLGQVDFGTPFYEFVSATRDGVMSALFETGLPQVAWDGDVVAPNKRVPYR